LNYSAVTILGGLSAQVSAKLVSEGLYSWYTNELSRLKQRIQGAHSSDMDRGARIIAYYRLLQEYKKLSGIWEIRTSSAQATINMTAQQQKLKNSQFTVPAWTPYTDVEIANKILLHLQ